MSEINFSLSNNGFLCEKNVKRSYRASFMVKPFKDNCLNNIEEISLHNNQREVPCKQFKVAPLPAIGRNVLRVSSLNPSDHSKCSFRITPLGKPFSTSQFTTQSASKKGIWKVENFYKLEKFSLAENLPNEILLHLFSYLPSDSLVTAGQVSQRWRRVAMTCSLWRCRSLEYDPASDSSFCRVLETAPCLQHLRFPRPPCKTSRRRVHRTLSATACRVSHVHVAWKNEAPRGLLERVSRVRGMRSLRLTGRLCKSSLGICLPVQEVVLRFKVSEEHDLDDRSRRSVRIVHGGSRLCDVWLTSLSVLVWVVFVRRDPQLVSLIETAAVTMMENINDHLLLHGLKKMASVRSELLKLNPTLPFLQRVDIDCAGLESYSSDLSTSAAADIQALRKTSVLAALAQSSCESVAHIFGVNIFLGLASSTLR